MRLWRRKPADRNGPAPESSEAERAERERRERRALQRQAVRTRLAEESAGGKGLLIVHTGPGKGKSTAALGMVLRALGHGFRVGIVQFAGSARESGERAALAQFGDQVSLHGYGDGVPGGLSDDERERAAAESAWEEAGRLVADPEVRVVLLDDLNVALRRKRLPLSEVVAALKARPKAQHVVVTGRNAADEMIAAADLVTEMFMIKHPFHAGVKAQPGIEF